MITSDASASALASLPPSFVIYVKGPRQILVCLGPEMITFLNGGQFNCTSTDIFTAQWLTESYVKIRHKMRALYKAARAQSKKPWTIRDQEFGKNLAQQILRRIIGIIRNYHRGGRRAVRQVAQRCRYLLGKSTFRCS